jgi:hypothetical protein
MLWFQADLGGGVTLSNAPRAAETHWGQLVCAWSEERGMRAGEGVGVQLRVGADGVHAQRV